MSEYLQNIASDVNKTLPISLLGWIAVVPWKVAMFF